MERRKVAGIGTALVVALGLASAAGAANLALLDHGGTGSKLGTLNGADAAQVVASSVIKDTTSAPSGSSELSAPPPATNDETSEAPASPESIAPPDTEAPSVPVAAPQSTPAASVSRTTSRPSTTTTVKSTTTTARRRRRGSTTSTTNQICSPRDAFAHCDD
jgi:hypothetical protein